MPASVVSSPTAVTRTRTELSVAIVPATTVLPTPLATGFDSPVIIDSSNSASFLNSAVGRHTAAGANEYEHPRLELLYVNGPGSLNLDDLGFVWQQGRERLEGAGCLPEGLHLLPMPEQHDVNQQRKLPPELEIQRTGLRRDARHVRDDDRERDEEHHPRLPIPDLSYAALQERESAVEEDDRSEDGGDATREWERGRRVVEPVLDGLRPNEDRNSEQQRYPESVAEHGHAMARVHVVRCVLLVRRVVVMAGPLLVPCVMAGHPVCFMPRVVVYDLTLLCVVLLLLMIHVPSHW